MFFYLKFMEKSEKCKSLVIKKGQISGTAVQSRNVDYYCNAR